jgi:hypothetical protein
MNDFSPFNFFLILQLHSIGPLFGYPVMVIEPVLNKQFFDYFTNNTEDRNHCFPILLMIGSCDNIETGMVRLVLIREIDTYT